MTGDSALFQFSIDIGRNSQTRFSGVLINNVQIIIQLTQWQIIYLQGRYIEHGPSTDLEEGSFLIWKCLFCLKKLHSKAPAIRGVIYNSIFFLFFSVELFIKRKM